MLLPFVPDTDTLRQRALHMPLLFQLALHKAQHGQLNPAALPAILGGIQRYGNAQTQLDESTAHHVVWRDGATRLLHFPSAATNDRAPVFILPSLINSARIFDLVPERSFLRWMCENGNRDVYVLDWGDLTGNPHGETLPALLQNIILPAMRTVRESHRQGLHLMGYCLGGLLALHAQKQMPDITSLTLLAMPYDTQQEGDGIAPHIRTWLALLQPLMQVQPVIPSSWLYSFFATLPETDTPEKFARITNLSESDPAFRLFLAVEDWAQQAPPVPARLLRECLDALYVDHVVATEHLARDVRIPTHVVTPENDRIVPPVSALAVVDDLADVTADQPACGHVGAMAGGAGPRLVWPLLRDWWNNTGF